MRRKYRVAHVITRLELGGAQQNTLFSTAHHDRERFEVHLLAGSGGILDREALATPDTHVELTPWLKHPVAPVADAVALFRLRRYFKKHRIDLVHTHSSKAGVLGRFAAVAAGVPAVVHTVHGWSFNDTQSRARRGLYVALERRAARSTDRLLVVSSRNRDDGLSRGIGHDEQYEVLRSGIEIERYAAAAADRAATRQALGFDPADRVVGTVACLKPQKAPLDFVRAAAAACARDERLRFFIAGDGELRPQVTALARDLKLGGRLQVLGWRRDVPQLLHAMDAFLLTSLFEGLPRAVLQAMAAGVPVVATNVDGTPEVVQDGETGLLVPPRQPEAAARGLLRLLTDATLRERCVRNARRRLTRDFDIHEMVRRLDRTYLALLEPIAPAATDGNERGGDVDGTARPVARCEGG